MSVGYLETDAHCPPHDPVIGPDKDIFDVCLGRPPPLLQGIPVEVEELEALDPEHEAGAVEAVNQLQLDSQILLGEVIQHSKMNLVILWFTASLYKVLPCIHETLHESCPVLREAQAGQPVIADPLMVHVPIGECGPGGGGGRG